MSTQRRARPRKIHSSAQTELSADSPRQSHCCMEQLGVVSTHCGARQLWIAHAWCMPCNCNHRVVECSEESNRTWCTPHRASSACWQRAHAERLLAASARRKSACCPHLSRLARLEEGDDGADTDAGGTRTHARQTNTSQSGTEHAKLAGAWLLRTGPHGAAPRRLQLAAQSWQSTVRSQSHTRAKSGCAVSARDASDLRSACDQQC